MISCPICMGCPDISDGTKNPSHFCKCLRLTFHPRADYWVFMSKPDHTGESLHLTSCGELWYSSKGRSDPVKNVVDRREELVHRFVTHVLVMEVMES